MQLTGKQIVERGIVTGFSEAGIQQQGVDVRLREVVSFTPSGVGGKPGIVPAVGKTILRDRKSVPTNLDQGPEGAWLLLCRGHYLDDGCALPRNPGEGRSPESPGGYLRGDGMRRNAGCSRFPKG